MIRRASSLATLLLFVFASQTSAQAMPPGFARNPYGVAGYPKSLTYLNMPITSTFYDWIPHEKARYITVRPYSPPRGGVAADDSKNPYFWNLSSGMIGRSEADRAKFRDYVLRNRGRVWIIGNEPEVTSQDNLTPTQYAQMYRTYYSTVSQLDPSATFAIASVGQVTYHAEFDKVKPYYDAIFAEYKRLYGVDLPFHYWNLHAYYAGWAPSHASTPTSMVDAVFTKLINP